MRLRIRLDGSNLRRWLVTLLDHVSKLPDIVIEIAYASGSGSRSAEADRLFRFEALLSRCGRTGVARAGREDFAHFSQAPAAAPDLILDLCDADADLGDAPVWRLTFDGGSGETSLIAACMAGRTPEVAIVCADAIVASARIGIESRVNLLIACEDVLARTTTLLVAALSGKRPNLADRQRAVAADVHAPPQSTSLARYAPRATARAVGRYLQRLGYHAPHWWVGWRKLDGPDAIALRRHPERGWRRLPDDGTRFYADPFPIEHQGRTFLFVEDFEHARGKAAISVVAFGPDGPLGQPTIVLDEPYHLSYPFVFAADGEVWLIPESCANRSVDLYRATAFPSGWVKEATLLSNIVASDATLVQHGGFWWMLATARDLVPPTTGPVTRGSYSDALHLWSAPDFRGPWTPHRQNPVLIDIASARSAGRIVERDGALVRPVQDCRLGYGEAMSIARIDRLDEDGYAQTVETALRTGPLWPGVGLHTLNRTRDFEFIDGCGRSPRYRFRRP